MPSHPLLLFEIHKAADGDGKAHPALVEVDGEWNGFSRIIKGLSEGDVIVALGAFKLKDGDSVRTVAQ